MAKRIYAGGLKFNGCPTRQKTNLHLIWVYTLFCTLLLSLSLDAKVYDCFPFFNEIELLKMRLEELDPYVDYFVLVESAETQRGAEKPFYFRENRHLFEDYLNKIIHIEVDERHPEMGMWERENYQRNCILRGLKGCEPRDLIFISDVDELPRPEVFARIVKQMEAPAAVREKKAMRGFRTEEYSWPAYSLQMDIFYFQLNRSTPDRRCWGGGTWEGTVVTYYANVLEHGAQHYRDLRSVNPRIENAGWHFTWMGGRDRVRQKLASVVEGRSDAYELSDEEVNEWVNGHPAFPVDASFPRYIQKNKDYLISIGFLEDIEKSLFEE